MENNLFNKNYNKYWKKRVSSSSDGSEVPTPSVFGQLIKEMDIKKNDKVLDLGCGDGRNFNEISKYSNLVYGIDIDISMIEDAANYNYHSLHSAKAENTNFPSNYLDKILALGVFDVVEQEKGLIELNRILKVGGVCGFTGKNSDYLDDDQLAFVAERNAKLKDFPNHFTDIKKLINEIKPAEAKDLIDKKIVEGGMIPKLLNSIDAVENGVKGVVIIDGRKLHSILFEIFSDEGSGTLIRK